MQRNKLALKPFFYKFFKFYNRRNDTIKQKLGDIIYKVPAQGFTPGSPQYNYQTLLTPANFEILNEEFLRHETISIYETCDSLKIGWVQCYFKSLRVYTEDCECGIFKSHHFPCRHIFAVRKYYNLPLYNPNLVLERCTIQYNIEKQPTLQSAREIQPSISVPETSQVKKNSYQRIPSKNYSDSRQRFKAMQEVAGNIVQSPSSLSEKQFVLFLEVMCKLSTWLSESHEVDVILKNNSLPPPANIFQNSSIPTVGKKNATIDSDTNNLLLGNLVLSTPIRIKGKPKNNDKCHSSTRKKINI